MRALLPGIMVAILLVGCSDDEVGTGDRLEGARAHDSLLETASLQHGLDSLFRAYDASFRHRPDTSGAAAWTDSMLSSMSLEEKVGQLFIVHLEESGARTAAATHHVGGFLVPRLLGPYEVLGRVRELQQVARVPLFFAADYERGVGRFNNTLTELPSNMAIGATRDTLYAAAAGRLTAIEARAAGVNLLLAPVVDVNNNPDNPIINIRSYGEDPELVGRMGAAFVQEAQRHGLLTTLKHFPGHGDTEVDTHARMGVVEGDRTELEDVELRPYRTAMARSVQPTAVMTAHLWIPAFDAEPLPATFSRGILTDLLRTDLGFEGVVITDDVRMGALQTEYPESERILRPLEAGADVVLTPADLPRAVRIVLDGIRSGRISEESLNESVRRVLKAKAAAGLHRERPPSREHLERLMEEPRGAHLAQAIADRSITLLKTAPVMPLDDERVAVVHLTNYRGSESIAAAMDLLDESLNVSRSDRFDDAPSTSAAGAVLDRADAADVVVLALYLRLVAGRGEAGLFAGQTELVHRLLERNVPVVLVTFGNPYAGSTFRSADVVVAAYDQSLPTIRAAARVLKGEQPPLGRLPITVEPFGPGLERVE